MFVKTELTVDLGRFPINKNSGSKFRKFHMPNQTVHSDCTDPSHGMFGYCSCKQDTKERYWGITYFVKLKGTFQSDQPK